MALTERARGSLTSDEIVDTADLLLRELGLDGFSMRKLATALGVTPMTLYSRFEDKEALLGAVLRRAIDALDFADVEGPWEERVVRYAFAVRDHLLAARHVLPLVQGSEHFGASIGASTEAGLELMAAGGFEGVAAVENFRLIFWHAIGAALASGSMLESNVDSLRSIVAAEPDRYRHLADAASAFEPIDPDRLFDRTTRLIAAGLAATAPALQPESKENP